MKPVIFPPGRARLSTKPLPIRVGNGYKDNRNCLGRFFERRNDWGTLAEDAVAL